MSEQQELVRLVPGKTDVELANEFRALVRPHLEGLAGVMTKAKHAGFILGFTVSQDSFGQQFRVGEITVTKPL